MSEIIPGKYEAKLKDYWIGKTKEGIPQAELLFEWEHGGQIHDMLWFGSFKEKARPWTIKTLLYCGFHGNDLSKIADGPSGNALEAGKSLQITVVGETDQNGKYRLRIQWVNPPGGGAFRDKATRGDIASFFSGMKGDVHNLRNETGIKDTDTNENRQFDDIPF